MSSLYSQPQRITALWSVLISRPTDGRRLSWPVWLDIEVVYPPEDRLLCQYQPTDSAAAGDRLLCSTVAESRTELETVNE